MLATLGVFIGGGLGSVLRYIISGRIGNHWGIMLVNIMGAFMIGLLYHFFMTKIDLRSETRAFIMTGLLGGFTTFSTYLLDFSNLLSNQKTAEAFMYLLGSVLIGLIFLYLGMLLGRSCNG